MVLMRNEGHVRMRQVENWFLLIKGIVFIVVWVFFFFIPSLLHFFFSNFYFFMFTGVLPTSVSV